MPIKSRIRTIPNFPKEGIQFRDITSLLKDPEGFKLTIDQLVDRYKDRGIEVIVGIEARGFILGAAMAYNMGLGFVPIRKAGKLPGETIKEDYQLEYGVDTIEVHVDAIEKGQKVLIVDDLLATGGTILGAISLVEKTGGIVEESCFIVDLPDIGGSKKLTDGGHKWYALTEFEGD
ncbi:MAG: adenine phosphoribosyltransferase [Halobacteriovoraceae bacterium]|jgi:adenine phosphoribosyltransferase|nr:adenine phosphoribosyltransferase [Halobacteriovoraceae bacterium]MBT5093492.1 adenine phosphoribosyltransferase [Halobacteriovoraceae bacterium]